MSSRRKKKTAGPLTAAGLVRFFEDVEARITISPTAIVIIAFTFIAVITIMNLLIR